MALNNAIRQKNKEKTIEDMADWKKARENLWLTELAMADAERQKGVI